MSGELCSSSLYPSLYLLLSLSILCLSSTLAGKAPLNMATQDPTKGDIEATPQKTSVDHYDDVDNEKAGYDRAGAIEAENAEHNMGVIDAVKAYPAASFWAFVMSCTIVSSQAASPTLRCNPIPSNISDHNHLQIMESYCVFLMGNFIATPRFAEDFGKYNDVEGKSFIAASWQSAFQCGGPVGAFIGVFLAGPITSKIGYRWATIGGLMFLNAFIFIFFFAKSQGVFLASQLLEGIPWGIFIANAPAYCSEIVPLRLRAPATQMLQMFWAIGSIIVGGITYHYNQLDDPDAYRYVVSPMAGRVAVC